MSSLTGSNINTSNSTQLTQSGPRLRLDSTLLTVTHSQLLLRPSLSREGGETEEISVRSGIELETGNVYGASSEVMNSLYNLVIA